MEKFDAERFVNEKIEFERIGGLGRGTVSFMVRPGVYSVIGESSADKFIFIKDAVLKMVKEAYEAGKREAVEGTRVDRNGASAPSYETGKAAEFVESRLYLSEGGVLACFIIPSLSALFSPASPGGFLVDLRREVASWLTMADEVGYERGRLDAFREVSRRGADSMDPIRSALDKSKKSLDEIRGQIRCFKEAEKAEEDRLRAEEIRIAMLEQLLEGEGK